MGRFLLWLWQLPQNLIGICMWIYFDISGRIFRTEEYGWRDVNFVDGFPGGISLGKYVFLNTRYLNEENAISVRHELGHCKQSSYLSWLYLLVIGLPSILWAAFYKYNPEDPNGYYRFYTERWADKLSDIDRFSDGYAK